MINDNRKYDLKDYNKRLRRDDPDSRAMVTTLQKVFPILLVIAVVLGFVLIGAALGKANSRVDPASSLSGTPEVTDFVLQSEETTTAYEIVESLPQDDLADAYWGPLVEAENPVPYEHFEVKGLYLHSADNMDANIELAANSEINTFVIDLKEGDGVYFNSSNELANSIGYVQYRYNLEEVCQRCHDNDIRVIGRIVCFKDPYLASVYPDRAICDSAGNVLYFTTEGSQAFANPYDTRNWDYLIDLALEAIDMGVDEIQFDYVRFPTGSTTSGASPYFGIESEVPSKAAAVNRFLQTARIRIQDTLGIPVGGDIFGIAVTSSLDGDLLGQDWATVGFTGVDSLCPMIYPSHYAMGTVMNHFTYNTPDKFPYEIMLNALYIGSEYHDQEGYSQVRPYLQAFTAYYLGEGNYLEYDYDAINAQIKALQDQDHPINEFILWNSNCLYPEGNYGGYND